MVANETKTIMEIKAEIVYSTPTFFILHQIKGGLIFMSKALHCDRCGANFLPVLLSKQQTVTTIPEIKVQTKEDINKNVCFFVKTNINLCSNCTNDFFKFMKEFTNEADYLCMAANSVPVVDNECNDYDDWISIRERKYARTQSDSYSETSERKDDPK